MRVAIIDEELPYPLNSGKRIRTFQLISRLAERHQITYVCHRNADADECDRATAVFRDLGIETIVVSRPVPPKSGPGFYGRLAANLLSPLPYSVASHTSDELLRALRDVQARQEIDLWQAEWTPYAQSFQVLGNARRLIMAHNVESGIWRRYYESETNPAKRWYIGRQWRKYERFERRVFQEADLTVAVSDEDASLIRAQFGAEHVDVVENGVDTAYFQPDRTERDPNQILFLGSLDWRPNLDAVDQLLNTIFPAVRARQPSARLCLVGRNPPESLRTRVAEASGVELHASVPDVRPFLARSAVMVVPLRIGGGSRLKILEAFAAGLPVISTRVGAEGLRVSDGVHLAAVDHLGQMAARILDGLHNPKPGLALAKPARRLVEEEYDWRILADRLDELWTQTVKRETVVQDRNRLWNETSQQARMVPNAFKGG
jgi:glycosyltransferase involved in cell wall biosynthesis